MITKELENDFKFRVSIQIIKLIKIFTIFFSVLTQFIQQS